MEEQFSRGVLRGLPETVLFICWDGPQVVAADEVHPGTAVSLARGWVEKGYRIVIKYTLTVEQRRALLAINPPTTTDPYDYQPNSALLPLGVPGTWMAPFRDRVASAYEKVTARNQFSFAVTHGKVERQTCCQKCGAEEGSEGVTRTIEAHHENYARPFDVVYLCRTCHRRRHVLKNQSVPIEDWLPQPPATPMKPPTVGCEASGLSRERISDILRTLPHGMYMFRMLRDVRPQRGGHYELYVSGRNDKERRLAELVVGYPTTRDGQRTEFADAVKWIESAVGSLIVIALRDDPKIKGDRFIYTAQRVWRASDLVAA